MSRREGNEADISGSGASGAKLLGDDRKANHSMIRSPVPGDPGVTSTRRSARSDRRLAILGRCESEMQGIRSLTEVTTGRAGCLVSSETNLGNTPQSQCNHSAQAVDSGTRVQATLRLDGTAVVSKDVDLVPNHYLCNLTSINPLTIVFNTDCRVRPNAAVGYTSITGGCRPGVLGCGERISRFCWGRERQYIMLRGISIQSEDPGYLRGICS